MSDFKNDCYKLAHKHCLCIEFVLAEDQRHGFHTGQLIDYRLEPNSSDEKDAPPDKLTLAFATADVVMLGWKLSSWLALGMSGLVGTTVAPVHVRFAGNDAGDWGVPLLGAALSAEADWN